MNTDIEITITVDTNDADYNTKSTIISTDRLELIRPLIEAIKQFKPYRSATPGQTYANTHYSNYPCGDYAPHTHLGEMSAEEIYPQISEQIHEMFKDLCPSGEHGFHTIKSIYVTPAVVKTKLL